MAILRHTTLGTEHPLASPDRVGTLPDSELRLTHPSVSAQHAVFLWRNGAWTLHDLDSRNGTFVHGRRLAHGEHYPLAPDDVLVFGDPAESWKVIDLGAPGMIAIRDDGPIRTSDGGSLALPDDDAPEVQVYQSGARWIIEQDSDAYPFEGRATLRIAGHTWRLLCPISQSDTTPAAKGSHSLHKLTLRLLVNADESFVQLVLVPTKGDPIHLGHRPYSHLLLRLAEERDRDRAEGTRTEAEQGWIDRDVLLDRLHLEAGDEDLVNTHVFQVRRELIKLNIRHVDELVVRRKTRLPGERAMTPQIRLGVAAVEILRDGERPSSPAAPVS